ncbi:MAG: isochorismatase [Candidatus Entotheonella factor]|uniref:Isochorismatase n=1 Tax=Entotheonella factor TaxID=1429438 RepID=W4LSN2_ENTF1|nr:cysteine hydrolase family protein [Candidatus Entotheonella palauensis]ETX00427.1 MAG: isochorismatase [Candidatus Entotheonella factor]
MEALLIIDMQVGMLESEAPPRDVDLVVQRINAVASAMRNSNRLVIFIQHCGPKGDPFAPGESGWSFLPSLERTENDLVVSKTTCDAFYKTELDTLLQQHQIDELVITGWATDFCVDTTIRAAASRDYDITVIGDAHTAADRTHLDAASIIQHHNSTWSALIVPRRHIRIVMADAVVRQLSG